MPPAVVGRERELEALRALVQGGGSLVLRGEPGVGKSTLLELTAESAIEHGVEVLRTVGVESEAHLPFGGLHHLLRPLLAAVEALPVRQRDALMAAFGMGAVTAPPEIFLIGLASLDLLAERASGSRVLVVVEDAHWLDGPSCDVLAFIARRIEL